MVEPVIKILVCRAHTQWIGRAGAAVRPTQPLEKDMDTKGSNMH